MTDPANRQSCLKCGTPGMEGKGLIRVECGAFCDGTFLACARCKELIDGKGKKGTNFSRLCYTCGGKPGNAVGFGGRKGRASMSDNNPWGDNAMRAREGD